MYTVDEITYRKLEEKDLRLMHKWLNTDFVIEWYDKGGSSFNTIKNKYLPRIKGQEPVYSYVIVYNNNDIGYIQSYMVESSSEYSQYLDCNECFAGIDLFIGEQDFIHKGLGKHILIKFLQEHIFNSNRIVGCVIDPEPNNKCAIRAYEKAGFKYLKTIQVLSQEEKAYLMVLYKNEVENKVLESKGLILASPVYVGMPTSLIMAFIQRATMVSFNNGRTLMGKIGGAISIGGEAGQLATIKDITQFYLLNEMIVVGSEYWNIGVASKKGDIKVNINYPSINFKKYIEALYKYCKNRLSLILTISLFRTLFKEF